tara:strand:+ start:17023 stop:17952 length:930 start_codon:yes stop_codon:yes gene_type:complete
MTDIDKLVECYRTNQYSCSKKPIDTFFNIDTIYVVGDIHGDFNVLLRSLKKAGIIKGINKNNRYKWMIKDAHVVQLGDILDKGGRGISSEAQAMEEYHIYDYLNQLDIVAQKEKGAVHYLIGNHEIMNMLGNFNYVHKTHLDSTGIDLRRQLFKPGGYMAKLLACHSFGILKINNWFFCHAGILPQHVANKSITEINTLIRQILRGERSRESLSSDEMGMIFGPEGFLWNRKYKYGDQNSCNLLKNTLINLKEPNGGMIIGHTPQKKLNNMCNKKLWFADVGLSDAFGEDFNSNQILKITKEEDIEIIS